MKPKVYTVKQVNKYIKNLLEDDIILQDLFIEGEISNFTKHSSGHLYFTLKDEFAAISCVMFKGEALGLKFKPQNGLKCIVYGRVSLYEKTGQYQLYAELLEPAGVGGLHVAFEQLKEKLLKEGLFDSAHKKEIPQFVRCVGVVTSPTGAAVRDIINVCKRRDKTVSIVVAPAKVQGEGAEKSIASAIKLLNKWGKADVIIVGRGGGSIEDLWAFNEEITARAVYASKIPVISAVGHETDFTICDFVADMRAPTPSAAAEMAVFNKEDIIEHVSFLTTRLKKAIRHVFDYKSVIQQYEKKMKRDLGFKLQNAKIRLSGAMGLLHQLSPLNVLKRGFALVYDEDGNIKTSVKEFSENQVVDIKLSDGFLKSRINEITVGNNGE